MQLISGPLCSVLLVFTRTPNWISLFVAWKVVYVGGFPTYTFNVMERWCYTIMVLFLGGWCTFHVNNRKIYRVFSTFLRTWWFQYSHTNQIIYYQYLRVQTVAQFKHGKPQNPWPISASKHSGLIANRMLTRIQRRLFHFNKK